MEKLTINDLKNHLSEFQQILDCYGELQLLKEFTVPDLLCLKLGIKPGSKLLFIYMGLNPHDHTISQYLAWLEDEGGMLVDMYYEPSALLLKGSKPMLTDGGFMGYGKNTKRPIPMEITWENGRPQAKEIRSEKIMELIDVPLIAPTEDYVEMMSDASFNIRYLLFGNPNFILSMPEGMEACLSYMNSDGRNSVCLDDSFCINMKTNGAKLRQLIVEAGDATPQEFEKIIRSFDE
jgi:hypothetical protein